MTTLLLLLCVFVLTWFAGLPPPFRIVLFVVEAVVLILVVLPVAGLRYPWFGAP